jgi:hypothetical protein
MRCLVSPTLDDCCSDLNYTMATRMLMEILVYRHRVVRLLDAPCGAAFWWPPLLERIRRFVPCFEYHGVDVVESVIESK